MWQCLTCLCNIFDWTYLRVDGRPANQIANNDIIKLAKSVSKWAASVAIAKLLDHTPPTISRHINAKHRILAIINFLRACLSIPSLRPLSLWQCSKMQTNQTQSLIKIYTTISKTKSCETRARSINSFPIPRSSNFIPLSAGYTYFQFVSTPILAHCSNSLINGHVNSKRSLVNQLVSMYRTIYCHKI